MTILRLVLLSLVMSLSACYSASAHECWWNGHYWVCPPRIPEFRGFSPGYGYWHERDWDRERDWRRHEWRERYPYDRR